MYIGEKAREKFGGKFAGNWGGRVKETPLKMAGTSRKIGGDAWQRTPRNGAKHPP
jgi:hypothetical protein